MYSIIRHPSAFLPIVLSLAASLLVVSQVLFFGATHQTDEGTAAHVWQLLMILQLPIILFFTATYLPEQKRRALKIIGLQLLAIVIATLPVLLFKL